MNDRKKRKLKKTQTHEFSEEEDENFVSVDSVNKIIYDYLLKIGFENAGKALLKEQPVQNAHIIQPDIIEFIERTQSLVRKKKKRKLKHTSAAVLQTTTAQKQPVTTKSFLLEPLQKTVVKNVEPQVKKTKQQIDEQIETFASVKRESGNFSVDSYINIEQQTEEVPKPVPNTNNAYILARTINRTLPNPHEQRINNMEKFLGITKQKDFLTRIKSLEDRILELEQRGAFQYTLIDPKSEQDAIFHSPNQVRRPIKQEGEQSIKEELENVTNAPIMDDYRVDILSFDEEVRYDSFMDGENEPPFRFADPDVNFKFADDENSVHT